MEQRPLWRNEAWVLVLAGLAWLVSASDAGGEQPEEPRVEGGSVVAVVHAEGLAREGATAGHTAEARDGVRAALREVGAVPAEEPGGRIPEAGAPGTRAARGLEHP